MENVAMLEGVDEFITDGISARMLQGILKDISTERMPAEETCAETGEIAAKGD
jgi:hypothetical protein